MARYITAGYIMVRYMTAGYITTGYIMAAYITTSHIHSGRVHYGLLYYSRAYYGRVYCSIVETEKRHISTPVKRKSHLTIAFESSRRPPQPVSPWHCQKHILTQTTNEIYMIIYICTRPANRLCVLDPE